MPQYGGAYAGVGETGVHGIPFNPAAAATSGFEVSAEWTQFIASYSSQLTGESAEGGAASQGAPFVAMTLGVPGVDGVGVGLSFGAPYARAAGAVSSSSSQRFHGISGQLAVLEMGASVGVEPISGLQLGGGVAVQTLEAESRYALDSGAVLVELFGDDLADLIGDPLLEGVVDITNVQGRAVGAVFGAQWTALQPWTMAASYRTGSRIPVTGDVDLVPSNAFTLTLESELEGEIVMPAELQVLLARRWGPMRWAVEGHWIGWEDASVMAFEMVDPQLGSRDPALEGILEGYGLSDVSEIIQTQTDRSLGYQHTAGGGLRLDIDGENTFWMARTVYSSRAIPDAWVHPANIDFESIDTRIGAGLRTAAGLDIGVSAGWLFTPQRTITTSAASYLADPDEGPVYPSGNGTYSLRLFSAGLNLVYRHRP